MDKIISMIGESDTAHTSHLNRGLDDLASFGIDSLLLWKNWQRSNSCQLRAYSLGQLVSLPNREIKGTIHLSRLQHQTQITYFIHHSYLFHSRHLFCPTCLAILLTFLNQIPSFYLSLAYCFLSHPWSPKQLPAPSPIHNDPLPSSPNRTCSPLNLLSLQCLTPHKMPPQPFPDQSTPPNYHLHPSSMHPISLPTLPL